jgi:hypothetical protein
MALLVWSSATVQFSSRSSSSLGQQTGLDLGYQRKEARGSESVTLMYYLEAPHFLLSTSKTSKSISKGKFASRTCPSFFTVRLKAPCIPTFDPKTLYQPSGSGLEIHGTCSWHGNGFKGRHEKVRDRTCTSENLYYTLRVVEIRLEQTRKTASYALKI